MTIQALDKARWAARTLPEIQLQDVMLDKELPRSQRDVAKVAFWLSEEEYWYKQGKEGIREFKRIMKDIRLGLNPYNC